MPRKSSANNPSDGGEGHHLTSGDLARMLHVDLKTIHNWVNQGHVTGRRTKGRHLRFDRTEVVRFMRAYGYQIPSDVGALPPRVVLDAGPGARPGLKKQLSRGIQLSERAGLVAVALAVASGDQEVLVVDLDARTPKEVQAFIQAVREWELAAGLVIVGVSGKPATRRAFLRAGGNVSVESGNEGELRPLARWLTGGTEKAPQAVQLAEPLGA